MNEYEIDVFVNNSASRTLKRLMDKLYNLEERYDEWIDEDNRNLDKEDHIYYNGKRETVLELLAWLKEEVAS